MRAGGRADRRPGDPKWGRFGRVTEQRDSRRPWVLLFVAVAIVAANMRMTITGVGPLLEQIADDQGVSPAALGLLGSLPLLAWAAFCPLAHGLSTRIGLTNAVTVSLLVLTVGTVWRSFPGGPANLWVGTAIIGAGLAFANVLMPAVIKRDFPQRLALVMGAYTALLGGMAAVIAGISVPLSQIPFGDDVIGWRGALLLSGATLPIGIAVWIWAQRKRRGSADPAQPDAADPPTAVKPARSDAGRRIWRDPLAWLVSIYMGAQSVTFYVISTWLPHYETALGQSPVIAGIELMIYQIFGVAGSMLVPLFARGRLTRWLPALLPAIGLVAWLGMALLPGAMLLWIVIGGVAAGALLTVSLMLMAQRARTQDHAAALSGMAQSLAYLIAATGPIAFGWLHEVTGGWLLPFAVVWVAAVVVIVVGVPLGRPRYVLEPRG